MKSIFLILLCGLGLHSHAQIKSIYFSGNLMVKDSTIATSYGVFGKLADQNLWVLKRYDLENNLLNTGTYLDEDLKIPHGDFIYYSDVDFYNYANETYYAATNKVKFISERGHFENGLEEGRWFEYYPDDKIKSITTYSKGVKHGVYSNYNKHGKLLSQGLYKNGEKDGEWLIGTKKEYYVQGVQGKKPKINKKS